MHCVCVCVRQARERRQREEAERQKLLAAERPKQPKKKADEETKVSSYVCMCGHVLPLYQCTASKVLGAYASTLVIRRPFEALCVIEAILVCVCTPLCCTYAGQAGEGEAREGKPRGP